MYTTPKHAPDQRAEYTALTTREREALLTVWCGRASEADQIQLKHKLLECHDRRLWVACACVHDANTGARPLLCVSKTDSTIYLRRMQDRLAHAPSCPLASGQLKFGGDSDEVLDAVIDEAHGLRERDLRRELANEVNPEPKTAPSFFSDPSTISVATPTDDGDRQRSESAHSESDALGRRLTWLCKQAGLDRMDNSNSVAPVQRLLDYAATVPVLRATLKQYLFATPFAFALGWIADGARRAQQAGLGAACWWVTTVNRYNHNPSDRYVMVGSDDSGLRVPLRQPLRVFGESARDVAPVKYPLLMIAKCNAEGIVDAYAHPVLSEREWCLVDSALERKTARDILSGIDAVRESFHFPIKAHKPLYEWKGTGERPDFVVTATSHGRAFHLVIETMGFDTHSYRARKVEMRSKLGDSVDWHEDNRAFRPQLVKGAVSTALYNWLTMVAD